MFIGDYVKPFRLNLTLFSEDEALNFIKYHRKKPVFIMKDGETSFDDQERLLRCSEICLRQYAPENTVLIANASELEFDAVFVLAKYLGFETLGITTNREHSISAAVEQFIQIEDRTWTGHHQTMQIGGLDSQIIENSQGVLVLSSNPDPNAPFEKFPSCEAQLEYVVV